MHVIIIMLSYKKHNNQVQTKFINKKFCRKKIGGEKKVNFKRFQTAKWYICQKDTKNTQHNLNYNIIYVCRRVI